MSIEFFHLLLLIVIANGTPILSRRLFNDKFNLAIDFGLKLADNNPLFGTSKTWRGAISSLITTAAFSWLLGYPAITGLLIAAFAIVGDLLSSFIKRRMAMESSSMAPLLDQVPESLLPAIMTMHTFNLTITSIILIVLIFIIIELVLSHILYKYGIRKRPY